MGKAVFDETNSRHIRECGREPAAFGALRGGGPLETLRMLVVGQTMAALRRVVAAALARRAGCHDEPLQKRRQEHQREEARGHGTHRIVAAMVQISPTLRQAAGESFSQSKNRITREKAEGVASGGCRKPETWGQTRIPAR